MILMLNTIFQSCTSKTSSKIIVHGLPYTLSPAVMASNSILACSSASSGFLLSAVSSSLRASSPVNSGFSYRREPGGSTFAFVDVLVCTMSLWCCLLSRRIRKYSSIPASDIPTVTPTPTPAFVLELSPELAILCSVGGLSEDVEGIAVDFVGEAIAEVDGGAVFLVGDTEVEMERLFVDRVFDELLVIVAN